MTPRGSRALAALSIAACLASFITSCSLLPPAQVERKQESQTGERISLRQLVQLDFGRDAAFALCIEPACPTVTRKTLVTEQPPTAPAAVALEPTIENVSTLQPSAPPIQGEVADFHTAASEPQRLALILHFPLARAELTASDKAALDRLIRDARKADRIVITSRTDNVGSDTANQTVALARANLVRDYLRAKLPTRGDALVVDAQGSCCFIASNDTPEGRKQNRRVEIVLSVSEQVAP